MTSPRASTFSRRQIAITVALVVLAALVALIATIRSNRLDGDLLRADPATILDDPRLREAALTGGKPVYEKNCAICHGATGKGDQQKGIPDLTDDDHLYGYGTVAEIEEIARFGIRSHNKRGWNLAIMPAYATKIPDAAEKLPSQTPAQIEDLTQFLLAFTARATDPAAAKRGASTYQDAGCWDCHGRDAIGDPAIGAPTLTDDTWLFGGSHDQIRRTLERGRAGMSPAFVGQLSALQLREVAAYVASLAPKPVIPET